ncbi:unnamed protein product [Closterium sp. NIES-53]
MLHLLVTQSFTLPNSPQQNGIAERRIGLVMEVARTSMIHVAAPHFLWPFVVRYAAHQLNLWPHVSLPETSPTLRWTGKVGDASVFRVWGSRAFVRDTFTDKLSARAIPCVFLGFVPDASGWQFYHPTSRRVLPSQDDTFDESVPFYHPLPGTAPVQVAVVSGAAPGAASGGAEPGGAGSEGGGSGGAEPEGVEPGGAESEGAEPEGAESEGAESGGAEPRGAASYGGPAGASPRLSSQQLRKWLVQQAHRGSGAPRAGEPRDAGVGGAAVTTGAGDPTETGAAGAGGAGAGVAGVRGSGAEGAGGAGAGAVDPGAGGNVRPRPYFVPLPQEVLGVPSSTGLPPPFPCPPPGQSQPPLQPASPLPVPSPYTEQSGGLTKRRQPASRPVSRVRTARRAPRLRPPPVPGTHTMALHPSSVPLRVPLPAPPESSLPAVPDPESDRARAASPTVAHLLATALTDPSFESAAASALVAELLDFAAACRLDYASALVAESVPASPSSVGGECALSTDVLEDRQEDFESLTAAVPRFASLLLDPEGDPDAPDIPTPRSYAEAITGPYSSQWQAAMDAEMASWKSTGTYVDEDPPPGVKIVDGMWIFRVKRPPGSPPAFKARYVARGFSQRQGHDYELHSLDFSTAFLQGSLHEEIWLRRPPGFTGSFPTGTQWSLRRPVYGLRQAPREWHDTLMTTLAALGYVPSTADPSLFQRTDTSLPPLYVLVYVDDLVFATADTEALTLVKARRTITLTQSHMVHQVLRRFGFQYSSPQLTPLSTSHSLSDPPSDESVEPSGSYPELVGCLITPGMGLVLGGWGPVVLTGHADASWVDDSATQRSSQGYTFGLGSGSELRWLTYLLTDLGEQPHSPPVLYVDNKAMIALCQEHRLEHRTKHIALRYFLARELQQRDQLRLAYMATRSNTADVFTKALPPGDHQRFVTVLGLSTAASALVIELVDFAAACRLDYTTSLGVSTAPAAAANSTVRSQRTTRDAVARLAVRSHLPPAERAHFGLYKTAPSLYDAVVARYSSPATAALSRLMLPYLFLDLAAFATVADLVAHLRTSDARYRAALPTKDHFLSLCPTELTIDMLEERLAAAKKSILVVGASRGDHRTPFFEGCSPVPLLPSVASAAAVDLIGTEEVGAASAPSGRRRNSKGKGSKGGGGGVGGSGGGSGGGEGSGGGGGGGTGSGGFSGGGGGGGGSGSGGGGSGSGGGGGGGGGAGRGAAAQRGGFGGSQRQQQPRSRETPSAQQLREWYAGRGRSGGAGPCTYVLRTGSHRGEACGLQHTTQRCFGRLTNAWHAQFPDAVELHRWHDLLRQKMAIFDLDFDAILAAMYALTDSAEGDCYLSVPPDPGIEGAALGASASAAPGTGESAAPGAGESALSGTAPTEALHTFTLDSGASRSFFRDSTTLTPLSRPVAVSLADPSRGPSPCALFHGSTVSCGPVGLAVGTPPPLVLYEPGSSLYTLTTASPPVSASGQVAASSQVFAAASRSSPASAPCSCRPLSHETLLWHHRLGHPSLPRLRGMASHTLVSGLTRSLPPLSPGPAPSCVPCVEGRQRAAPHSSTFPPTEAPLQTLHMDLWGPARIRGQGHERYFLLIVDDYSCYTTVFPLRSKGELPAVLIDWIRGARCQLSESFERPP